MKKLIFSVAVLTAIATTSCKKAYECTCESSYTYSYEAVMSDPDAVQYVADENADEAEYTKYTDKTVSTIDKASKADANAACASYETVNTYPQEDSGDFDNDADEEEIAYNEIEKESVKCSLEKK